MNELSLALMLLFTSHAPARPAACSIHALTTSTPASLLAQVKVSYATAVKLAQEAFPAALPANGALEIEAGCLVYAFELRTTVPPGEIWVDAGNGRILPQPAEAARRPDGEAGAGKAPPGKPPSPSGRR